MKKSSSQKSKLHSSFLALLAMITLPCFGWGSAGHRLIGEIAFQHLYPDVKHQVLQTLKPLESETGYYSFSFATTWADRIRSQDITAFNQWHYINLGFSTDHTPIPAYEQQNVAWAISQALVTLNSDRAPPIEKALFMNFLIHFVGDIHQPLHCASLVSKAHPAGDKGGNDYPIQYEKSKNLHQLWDGMVGQKTKNIRRTAKEWQERYPLASFKVELERMEPMEMAQESFNVAKTKAYRVAENTIPDARYLEDGQETSRRQVVLAGYRLACILNRIYERESPCLKF